MVSYCVGQKFPHDLYLNRGEFMVGMLNDSFMDMIVSLRDITPREITAVESGDVSMFLYQYKESPFVITDFGGGFLFDVSIEITKLPKEQQNEWLNADGNIVTIFLVDADTGILKAMRVFGVNFQNELKDICKMQVNKTTDYMIEQIQEAMLRMDTPIMAKNAIKSIEFKH